MTDPGLAIIIGNYIGGGIPSSSTSSNNIISESGIDIITEGGLNIIIQ
jgi:hypothetical protein